MITDPLFLALAAFAVLLVGISKGGFGGGMGLLAVPLLSLMISPALAAAIMLPILCTMDLFALYSFRGKWSKANLIALLPGALIGIVIGAFLFTSLRASDIKLVMGVMSLTFVAMQFHTQFLVKHPEAVPPAHGPHLPRGVFWGGVSGFTSFLAHAGGPPVTIYLLPQRLDKSVYQGTTVLFFTIMNYVKLVPYGALGLFQTDGLMTSLILLPLAPIGVWIGVWLHNRTDQTFFYRLCLITLGLIGVKLTWDGLVPLV